MALRETSREAFVKVAITREFGKFYILCFPIVTLKLTFGDILFVLLWKSDNEV